MGDGCPGYADVAGIGQCKLSGAEVGEQEAQRVGQVRRGRAGADRQGGEWIRVRHSVMAARLTAIALACVVFGGCSSRPDAPSPGSATPTPQTADSLIRQRLEAAQLAVNSDPINFGGAYFDEAAVENIQVLVPAGAPVVWRQVRYSANELARIHDEIVESWRQIGVEQISYVAIDTPNNLSSWLRQSTILSWQGNYVRGTATQSAS